MTRFETTFKNIDSKLYVVSINDALYVGDKNLYVAPTPGFTLSYETAGDDRLTPPIISSRCSIPLYIDAIRTAWDAFLVDLLASSSETRFSVNITEDGALFWKGIVNVEQLSIPDRNYQQISLTATDGFGILESIPYDNAGTLYTGWATFGVHITNCLKKLGLDYAVNSITNWGNSVGGTELMISLRVQHDAFKEIKDEEILPYDCLTVLRQIMTRFGCRMIQRGGVMWIEQYGYLAESSNTVYNYDKDGVYIMDNIETTDITSINKLAGGSKWYREQCKDATVQYAFKDSIAQNNLIIGLLNWEVQYNLGAMPTGNEETVGFGFDFKVKTTKNTSNSTVFKVQFIFTVEQDGKYLSNADGYEWITDSSARVRLNSYQTYRDFQAIEHTETIGFITPAMLSTANMYITWDYIYYSPVTGDVVEPDGVTTDIIKNVAVIIYGVGDANEGTKIVVGQSGNVSGEQIELDPLVIGDKPFLRSVGRIQSYNIEWINTDSWGYGTDESLNIDTLLAREIVAMQRKPVECRHYVLRSDVNVAYKIDGCIITNANYDANMGIWVVDCFAPVIDRTGITYTDYVDSETVGGLPGGIPSTPPTPDAQLWKSDGTYIEPVESEQIKGVVKTAKIITLTDGTTGLQLTKADGTTVIFNIDTTGLKVKLIARLSVCPGADNAPSSTVDIAGSIGLGARMCTGANGGTGVAITMQDTEAVYYCDTRNGDVDLNLTAANSAPRRTVWIRQLYDNAGMNYATTIKAAGTEKIYTKAGDASTIVLSTNGQWVMLQTVYVALNTWKWHVVASSGTV